MTFHIKLPPALDASVRSYVEKTGISFTAFFRVAVSVHLKERLDPHRRMSDDEYKATTWRAPWADGHALAHQKAHAKKVYGYSK